EPPGHAPARPPVRLAGWRRPHQDHVVATELGGPRDLPGALRAAVVEPRERLLVVLVAPEMPDREQRRTLRGWRRREAGERRLPEQVLHVHRLAGAEEGTIEDAVGDRRAVPGLGGQGEGGGSGARGARARH